MAIGPKMIAVPVDRRTTIKWVVEEYRCTQG